MKVIQNEKGLTFVELLVTMTIFGLIIISLYGLLDSGLQLFKKYDSRLEQLQHMRVAMETIGRDLRAAQSAAFNQNLKQLTLSVYGKTVKYGLESENIYGPSGLRGKQLWKDTQNQPLASYLDDFTVKIENYFVEVTLAAKSPEGKTLVLKNSFALRNK
ncbi:PulJ/GspJ family protein [Zhaonella formicivorans]|uniref:PulJ/GspJ family protein n=1 Tax=Zhaonella formicivorans TaxID=2528593 RepID=UPI0010D7E28A|nr:prepilin-type N-terminal cleavage/methylation domain-containing protein [Zhaonella formicivorans]